MLQALIDKNIKEALDLQYRRGERAGQERIFCLMHHMLNRLGYSMEEGSTLGTELRSYAHNYGCPIDLNGEAVEVEEGPCERCKAIETIYDVDTPRYLKLCGACENTPESHEPR